MGKNNPEQKFGYTNTFTSVLAKNVAGIAQAFMQ